MAKTRHIYEWFDNCHFRGSIAGLKYPSIRITHVKLPWRRAWSRLETPAVVKVDRHEEIDVLLYDTAPDFYVT